VGVETARPSAGGSPWHAWGITPPSPGAVESATKAPELAECRVPAALPLTYRDEGLEAIASASACSTWPLPQGGVEVQAREGALCVSEVRVLALDGSNQPKDGPMPGQLALDGRVQALSLEMVDAQRKVGYCDHLDLRYGIWVATFEACIPGLAAEAATVGRNVEVRSDYGTGWGLKSRGRWLLLDPSAPAVACGA
jgi:hypothetical protein